MRIADVDINVARKIAKDKALKYLSVAYKESDANIYVLCAKIDDEYVKEIEFIFSKRTVTLIIDKETIIELINNIYASEYEDFENEVIRKSIKAHASDIHFEPFKGYVAIRIRIDGLLKTTYLMTNEEYIKLLSKIKIKSELDITEKRRPQDGKLTIELDGISYDLRVSIINTINGEKLVIRILYGNVFNYSIDKLNLSTYQKSKLNKIIRINTGVVAITGPTGSGKSTTLYSILQEINNESVNIMTLEDPVEVEIKGINQISLNRNINMDFATGLKSILRQDPDVIMVGEIRDSETAEIVARAGITGHKVYSTIHTKDPREVYFRLEEMGVEGYLIRDSLVGIVSQRLVKVLCNKCKKLIEVKVLLNKEVRLYDKVGCQECSFTGYKGRELVSSIHYIDKNMKLKLVDIYNNTNILTNDEMIESIKGLFFDGRITEEDFLSFLENEELQFNYE